MLSTRQAHHILQLSERGSSSNPSWRAAEAAREMGFTVEGLR